MESDDTRRKVDSPSTPLDLASAIEDLLPAGRPVGLHEPWFVGDEWRNVKECIDSGWVSSVGSWVDRFERELADYTGANRAVLTVNGTAALQVCLRSVGVQAGDEVLLPSLTFVATANAISLMGARPHFVDIDSSSLGVDSSLLVEHLKDVGVRGASGLVNRVTGRRIRALILVHTLGYPARAEAVQEVTGRFGLELVEDAAESLGSWSSGRHSGRVGRASALSFNGNKIVTTGGGGAVITDDCGLADRAKHWTTTAKVPHPWEYRHDEIGWNFRMPNLNAALGSAQLAMIEETLRRKHLLHGAYCSALGSRVYRERSDVRPNHWLNLLLIENKEAKETLLKLLCDRGIQARPFWEPLHQLPMYRDCPRSDLRVTEDLHARGVCLPSSPQLWTDKA